VLHAKTGWERYESANRMRNQVLSELEALRGAVPAGRDAAFLLDRYERQWHRMGELWERYQGKGWPDVEGAEFESLRDEKSPRTRAALIAMLAAAPQPAQGEKQ
jgi:hypothetical protein